MGEQVHPESSLPVELDVHVHVTHHVGGSGGLVLPVAEGSVHYDPVVEQLGGHGDVEDVRAAVVLVAES